jgi:membrane-bound metal-dependent hydrolase YbcI (DUF457 family)
VAEQDPIPAASEQIYLPRASWGPAFFALGAALLVCGIFAEGFMVRAWVYAIFGAIFLLAALWSMVSAATRGFFRLPRRQRVRGAVLPVRTVRPPGRG